VVIHPPAKISGDVWNHWGTVEVDEPAAVVVACLNCTTAASTAPIAAVNPKTACKNIMTSPSIPADERATA
jgi:hypothetical protein